MFDNLAMMGAIASAIVNSAYFEQRVKRIAWISVSIVVTFDEDDGEIAGLYGYVYDADGNSVPASPDLDDIEPAACAYREALRLEGDKGFIKMLFQFNRVTRRVNAEFEYHDATRWQITPSNIDDMVPRLRLEEPGA